MASRQGLARGWGLHSLFAFLFRLTGPHRFRRLCFPQGWPGEGASRRLSAEPSGCPVIILAKLAAPTGLSHELAEDLEAWSG